MPPIAADFNTRFKHVCNSQSFCAGNTPEINNCCQFNVLIFILVGKTELVSSIDFIMNINKRRITISQKLIKMHRYFSTDSKYSLYYDM